MVNRSFPLGARDDRRTQRRQRGPHDPEARPLTRQDSKDGDGIDRAECGERGPRPERQQEQGIVAQRGARKVTKLPRQRSEPTREA